MPEGVKLTTAVFGDATAETDDGAPAVVEGVPEDDGLEGLPPAALFATAVNE